MARELPSEEEVAELAEATRNLNMGDFFDFATEVMETMSRDLRPVDVGLDSSFEKFLQITAVAIMGDPRSATSHLIAVFFMGMEYQKKLEREGQNLAQERGI